MNRNTMVPQTGNPPPEPMRAFRDSLQKILRGIEWHFADSVNSLGSFNLDRIKPNGQKEERDVYGFDAIASGEYRD